MSKKFMKRLGIGLALLLIGWSLYFVGNHLQWLTAWEVQRAVKTNKTKPKTKEQANHLMDSGKVKPDYTGNGGLSDKATMLKLAKSNQSEILRGYVAVPSFSINQPIYEGTSDHVLAIGAGFNTPNTVIGTGVNNVYAHNDGTYGVPYPMKPSKFSALQNMTDKTIIGKDIYLSDGHTAYRYRATELQRGVLVSTLNQMIAQKHQGKPIVRLIACLEDDEWWRQVKASGYTNFHANKRIILTGELVDSQPVSSLPSQLQNQLE